MHHFCSASILCCSNLLASADFTILNIMKSAKSRNSKKRILAYKSLINRGHEVEPCGTAEYMGRGEKISLKEQQSI